MNLEANRQRFEAALVRHTGLRCLRREAMGSGYADGHVNVCWIMWNAAKGVIYPEDVALYAAMNGHI
jgi:hypothetical protein